MSRFWNNLHLQISPNTIRLIGLGNPGPGFEHVPKCGEVKPVTGHYREIQEKFLAKYVYSGKM
jgi:hypothetical protein